MLKELHLYEEPTDKTILTTIAEKVIQGNPTLSSKSATICIMPLKFFFKSIFEIPELLNTTLKNTEMYLKSKTISNFASGELFKKKIKEFTSELIIPFILYLDDFKSTNL